MGGGVGTAKGACKLLLQPPFNKLPLSECLKHLKALDFIERMLLSIFAFWTTVSPHGLSPLLLAHPQNSQDQILTPPPTPEFLRKDFCLQPGLEWKVLLRRTWSGRKMLPLQFPELHSLTEGNRASFVRTLFSHPESDGKSSDVGVGGRRGTQSIRNCRK